jgi:hypothetical protein
MDTTIFLSGQVFLFLAWIFIIISAEDKDDIILYWAQVVFGLPLGAHYLHVALTSDVIPNIAGAGIILVSVYYAYIGFAKSLDYKKGRQ